MRGFSVTSANITSEFSSGTFPMLGILGNSSVFSDNVIHDCGPDATANDAIVVLVYANYCVLSNNFFYNIQDFDCHHVWGVGNLFTSCTISNYSNPSSTFNGVAGAGPHADGWQTWWTGAAVWSNVIERCYFTNCSSALFQLKGTPDNVTCYPGQEGYWVIRNCIVNKCESWPIISTDEFRFYNNLIYESGAGTGPTFLIGGNSQGTCLNHGKYFNNVHIACTSLMNGATLGPNAIEATNAFTASSLSWGGPGDILTTEAACKFVNAAAGNFRLQAGSSLIGKGVNLSSDLSMTVLDADGNARPSIAAWDVGPYQYATNAPNTNPPSITVQPQSVTMQTNQTATFIVTATNSPTTYQWYWKGSAVGGNSSSYTTPATTIADSNSIVFVAVSNSFGGVVSSNAYLYVTNGPPVSYLGLSFPAIAGTIGGSMTTNGGYLTYSGDYLSPAAAATATYYFTNAITGNYQIQSAFTATNNANNSVWIAVDPAGGVLIDPTDIWDMTNLSAKMQTNWVTWRGSNTTTNPQYSPLVISNLAAGAHTMVVAGREPYVVLQSFTLVLTNASQAPTKLSLVNGILSWSAVIGASYRVEYKTNFGQATWEVLGGVTATNAIASVAAVAARWPQCFYRVVSP